MDPVVGQKQQFNGSTRWIRTGNNDARETPDVCEENEDFAA